MKSIPYGRQSIDSEDLEEVAKVLTSDFLTQGPAVGRFEEALCELTGARYCVAVANATAALHLAVKSLGSADGAVGVTSPITFAASSNAFLYNGMRPDFCDVRAANALMDAGSLERLAERSPIAAVIPVHYAGRTCDMLAISRIARSRGAGIIEDAAHAIGGTDSDGHPVGSCRYSDMTVFSFHPVKTVTTGEGGAVTTNDERYRDRLRLLRSHGIHRDFNRYAPRGEGSSSDPWYYEMIDLGFNYRLSDIHAALGIAQLRKLGRFRRRRQDIARIYDERLAGLPWLRLLATEDRSSPCLHLYAVRIDFSALGLSRRAAMAALRTVGVQTQVHYIPVYQQPYYQQHFGFPRSYCPEAERFYEQALSLPLHPGMSQEDVERVISAVRALPESGR